MSEAALDARALESKAKALRDLEEIVEKLRAPDGCPWDRAQTLETLAPNLLEEACEAIDAIRGGAGAPTPEVCEELGDVLLNILLAARIAEEGGGFGIAEVAQAISAKLIRRHPHVFGSEKASSVEKVLTLWKEIKAREKGGEPQSHVGRIPRSLPAIAAAMKVGEQASKVGFDWPDAAGALEKVREETREVADELSRAAMAPGGAVKSGDDAVLPGGAVEPGGPALVHEVGDLLFAAVNLARKCGVDPEAALRGTVDRFIERFRAIEATTDVTKAPLERLEALWNEAKAEEAAALSAKTRAAKTRAANFPEGSPKK